MKILSKIAGMLSIISLIGLNFCGCNDQMNIKKLTDEDIKSYTENMNQDPLSGQITLNGQQLTVPMDINELLDMKFKFEEYQFNNENLENNTYIEDIPLSDGNDCENTEIKVTVYNTTGEDLKLSDSKVGTLTIKKNSDKYKNNIVLPRGITFDSTYDDVIKTYGNPQVDYYNQTGFIKYFSTESTKKNSSIDQIGNMEIQFDKKTGLISQVKIKDMPLGAD